ncbi:MULTISPECIES: PIN domain-containing protein [Halococcus]|uniref:Nucleotide-binding protein, PIN domain-containing protein n=1 Tax=Halococcus salifodinae DSM 8989 TaxID=1227456 RepID=M0MUE8_9EURY|nr:MULTISPECIES: PIN domain-containing protein [Halococcus]EMA48065.1 Nucleotide-binding protein, PIN domain-containing protein [Halococcus salifodinae DSM 8989]
MNDDYVPYPETIVIDANTIISATLTPGITREMLLTTEDELYSPAFIREEIATHRSVLRDKSGLSDAALDTLLDTLFTAIEILSEDRTNRSRETAEQTMEAIDPKDTLYVAAALELNAAIWSGDPDLHDQTLTPALTTEAIVARVRQAQRETDSECTRDE